MPNAKQMGLNPTGIQAVVDKQLESLRCILLFAITSWCLTGLYSSSSRCVNCVSTLSSTARCLSGDRGNECGQDESSIYGKRQRCQNLLLFTHLADDTPAAWVNTPEAGTPVLLSVCACVSVWIHSLHSHTLMVVNYIYSHICPGADWQNVSVNSRQQPLRPPPNIHSHSHRWGVRGVYYPGSQRYRGMKW